MAVTFKMVGSAITFDKYIEDFNFLDFLHL